MGKTNTKETLGDETDILVNSILESGVDGIIGGFPCQDVSIAGGAGLTGSRSGLVWKMVHTIRLVRPKIVLMENVASILYRGIERIHGAMASIGYDTEWDCISSGSVGAPHERERIYILAYPNSNGGERRFPHTIQRQQEFQGFQNIRSVEDLRERSAVPGPYICGSHHGLAKRLHGIGNGNPPCIIREITKGLK